MKRTNWMLETLVFAVVVACVVAMHVGWENLGASHFVVFAIVVGLGGFLIQRFLRQKK